MKSLVIFLVVITGFLLQKLYYRSVSSQLKVSQLENWQLTEKLQLSTAANEQLSSDLTASNKKLTALSAAHLAAQEQLKNTEFNYAEALQKLAELQHNAEHKNWANAVLPSATEHWLRQLQDSSNAPSATNISTQHTN